jgi:lactate dehydrogenase-like 2-hydroxyacid dehydrogenase
MTAVWVGPAAPEELVQAVKDGGGRLVEADAAEALVWYGGSVERLRQVLHPGVRWVQLPAAGVERWVQDGVVDRQRTWTSAAGCYAPAVAEHTLALLLAAAKELPALARASTYVPVLQISADAATVAARGPDLDLALDTAAPEGPAVGLTRLVAQAVEARYAPRAGRSGVVGFQVSRGLRGVSM